MVTQWVKWQHSEVKWSGPVYNIKQNTTTPTGQVGYDAEKLAEIVNVDAEKNKVMSLAITNMDSSKVLVKL